jgi:hypothetical protein
MAEMKENGSGMEEPELEDEEAATKGEKSNVAAHDS